MSEENIIKKRTIKEIKEMIETEVIKLEELSIEELYSLLDYETERLERGKGDMEIINKCAELLDRKNGKPLMTTEEMSEIISRAQAKYVKIVPDKPNKKPGIRVILKRAVIIAAAFTVLTTGTVAVTVTTGEFDLYTYIREVFSSKPTGTVINIDNLTFYQSSAPETLSSIKELIETKNRYSIA